VQDSLARLGPVRVQTYRPLFAYRFARERLRASAVASGALPRTVPEVLIVCTHNAGRSQLAAALVEHEAKGRVVVRSAGTDPAPTCTRGVRESLAELGIDASDAFPKRSRTSRAGRRRRHHDGVRRRVPGAARSALRRLGAP
jgi:hypothetical protein